MIWAIPGGDARLDNLTIVGPQSFFVRAIAIHFTRLNICTRLPSTSVT